MIYKKNRNKNKKKSAVEITDMVVPTTLSSLISKGTTNNGRLQSRKPLRFALILLVIFLVLSNMVSMSTLNVYVPFFAGSWHPVTTTVTQETNEDPAGSRLKIAVLSTFVVSTMWDKFSESSYVKKYTDHILNRECYCHLWNYQCIFNQTMELGLYAKPPDNRTNTAKVTAAAPSNTTSDPWWLEFGGWERVAHLQAALPKYDWVLYGDIDYIIKDMSRPIESFIREFDLYGKNDVNVLVPVDDNENDHQFAFSNFAILIKNSPFGRKLLENWRAFGMGLCPNGNFPDKSNKKKYSWEHSDQPGLWYALMKTHMDFNPNSMKPPGILTCNETTGLIANGYWMDINTYFYGNGYRRGNYGEDLAKVPDNQQIAWSQTHNDSMSGLGVDGNWLNGAKKFWHNAFALHYKKSSEQWNPEMQIELSMCKHIHGCSVSWNKTTGVRVGCRRNSSSAY